jgi:hypothetical protein
MGRRLIVFSSPLLLTILSGARNSGGGWKFGGNMRMPPGGGAAAVFQWLRIMGWDRHGTVGRTPWPEAPVIARIQLGRSMERNCCCIGYP